MKKNKTVVVSVFTPAECKSRLIDMGYSIVDGCVLPGVDSAVAHHIDMQLVKSGENEYICAPSVFEYYKHYFDMTDARLFCGKSEPSGKYPSDVMYNVAFTGKYAIHNYKYTDRVFLEKCLCERINVKQGYTKCNICVVSENAVITSDKGIADILSGFPVDVLQIRSGCISLPGYEYGFIGGCSGLIEKNLMAFTGNISLHPDYDSIYGFCKNHGVELCSLSKDNLVDIGTITLIG